MVFSICERNGIRFIADRFRLSLIGFCLNILINRFGNRLFPFRMPENLRPGMALYRNNDQAFEQILARKTAERRIPLFIELQPVLEKDEDNDEVVDGFLATANIFMLPEKCQYISESFGFPFSRANTVFPIFHCELSKESVYWAIC